MIESLQIAICSALVGNGLVLMSAQKGDVLDFWPNRWNRLIRFPENPNRAKLAKLATCPKCIAGQCALWAWLFCNLKVTFPPDLSVTCPPLYFLFLSILSAVTFARILEKFT